jgi:tRNA threonylcarbamoyladenosine biosynthesis protein TsaB
MSVRRGRKGHPAPAPRVEADPDAPLVLAVDTGSASDAVAVARGGLVIASRQVRRPRRQGAALALAIRGLLRSVGSQTSDLAAIAVGAGPGAFTGLRIGIATAQGIASALGIPTYAEPSPALWAAAVPGTGSVAVTLDARRGEIYGARYEVGTQDDPRPTGEVAAWDPRAWFEHLAAGAGPILLVGDGARLYAELAIEVLGDRAELPRWGAMAPNVGWLALRAADRLAAGDPSQVLRPVYLRDHDAAQRASS